MCHGNIMLHCILFVATLKSSWLSDVHLLAQSFYITPAHPPCTPFLHTLPASSWQSQHRHGEAAMPWTTSSSADEPEAAAKDGSRPCDKLHIPPSCVRSSAGLLCLQVLVPMIAYVAAPASGAHFNPIVTFAFMATGILVRLLHL